MMPFDGRVTILTEDRIHAKRIADVFKEIGILADFHEDFRSFWFDIMNERAVLAIIDVRLISDGQLHLKDHPGVLSKNVMLAVMYEERWNPLMSLAYEAPILGSIKLDEQFEKMFISEFKFILKKANENHRIQNELKELREHISGLEESQILLVKKNNLSQANSNKYRNTRAFLNNFKNMLRANHFYQALSYSIDICPGIESYSFLELSSNKMSLTSPFVTGKKWKDISKINLDKKYTNGLDAHAQSASIQIKNDVFGLKGDCIFLGPLSQGPYAVLMLKLIEENFLDLEAMKEQLAAFYLQENYKNLLSDYESAQELNLFDLLNLLSSRSESNKAVLSLDLKGIIEALEFGKGGNFNFKQFYHDFLTRLHRLGAKDFLWSIPSLYHFVFIVKDTEHEIFYNHLLDIVESIDLTRYFELSDEVLTFDFKLKVRYLPFSEKILLSELNKEMNPLVGPGMKKTNHIEVL